MRYVFIYSYIRSQKVIEQSEEHLLKVSEGLKTENPACEWLRENRLPFAFDWRDPEHYPPLVIWHGSSSPTAIGVGPKICAITRRGFWKWLRFWHAPFSGISVISNRVTPLHCDRGGTGRVDGHLIGIGEYENGRFSVPAFGYTFKYNPGTIVASHPRFFGMVATCVGNRAAHCFLHAGQRLKID